VVVAAELGKPSVVVYRGALMGSESGNGHYDLCGDDVCVSRRLLCASRAEGGRVLRRRSLSFRGVVLTVDWAGA
jgi:hypothetical protein